LVDNRNRLTGYNLQAGVKSLVDNRNRLTGYNPQAGVRFW